MRSGVMAHLLVDTCTSKMKFLYTIQGLETVLWFTRIFCSKFLRVHGQSFGTGHLFVLCTPSSVITKVRSIFFSSAGSMFKHCWNKLWPAKAYRLELHFDQWMHLQLYKISKIFVKKTVCPAADGKKPFFTNILFILWSLRCIHWSKWISRRVRFYWL